jgi:hypothetical protein
MFLRPSPKLDLRARIRLLYVLIGVGLPLRLSTILPELSRDSRSNQAPIEDPGVDIEHTMSCGFSYDYLR